MSYDPKAHGALCDACPLRDRRKVRPLGPANPKLVVVLDQPSYHDEKRGELGIGPAGVTLNELLWHNDVKRSEVWLTSALLCRTQVPNEDGARAYDPKLYFAWLRKENFLRRKAGEPPISNPLDCCRMRLYTELAHFERVALEAGQPNGAVVVSMGPVALKAVADKDSVLTWRGSPLVIEDFAPPAV